MYDDILIPTDGSEGVQRAINHGIELASLTDAHIHGLFVVDTAEATALPDGEWLTMANSLEDAGKEAVTDIERRAQKHDVPVKTAVEHGTPRDEIVDYAAEHDVDLIVMGTHGRSGIDRVLLGSVTDAVIRRADTPVLVKRIEEAQ